MGKRKGEGGKRKSKIERGKGKGGKAVRRYNGHSSKFEAL